MKIITQLVILTLSLLLVSAHDNINHYSTHPFTVPIRSCCDLRIFPPDRVPTGVYKMSMGTFTTANVYCNMTTDGGGWNVIQRNRKNSQLSFNKNWKEYEEGFGDLDKEFWAGLELMHTLTKQGQWEVRIDYQKTDKTWSYLHYNQFSVGSASEEYPLTVGGFTGVGTDSFAYQNKMKFSTPDNDNDEKSDGGNCAVKYKNGNWYKNCYNIGLNEQPPFVYPYVTTGIVIFIEMKIRPKDCITQ